MYEVNLSTEDIINHEKSNKMELMLNFNEYYNDKDKKPKTGCLHIFIRLVPDVENLKCNRVLREKFADDLELGPRMKDAIVFTIPLKNGTKINKDEETSANIAIAKRMFYQVQDSRMICQTSQFQVFLKNVLNKKVSLKDLTVILIVDGMQIALINENDDKDKKSVYYSFLTEISAAATNNDNPLNHCMLHRTFARPFNEMDVNRRYGNGRALGALELAVKDFKSFENINFLSIAETVFYQLNVTMVIG
ncbi:unnamed protein product [Rhizophagus irregularis]|nr:unnamed protein product [Rhizophagus irregularis]